MSEWTPEAQSYLEGYLQQVAALARHSGDDAPDIVENLREHIRREAEIDAGTFVTLERLRQVIAVVGTPEQVVEMDFPKASPKAAPEASAALLSGLSPEPVAPQITNVYPPSPPPKGKISSLTCLLMIIVFPFVALILITIISMVAAIAIPNFTRAREAANRASCQGNLKQIGLGLVRYAHDNEINNPPLSEEAGKLMFDSTDMEGLITDSSFLKCPSSRSSAMVGDSWEECIDDHDYIYLGHILLNEEEGLAYVEAYRKIANEGGSFDQDFQYADVATLYRVTEKNMDELGYAPAEIPVAFDRYPVHIPAGGSVLYLDGHVEFVKLNDKFPMTETFLNALESINE